MINTDNWKEFKLGDYFIPTRGTVKKLQTLPEGDIPIIAAARYNQGVAGYYDIEPKYDNTITVSCNGVGCGSTYFHDYPFNINGDAVALVNKGEVPIEALPFIAIVYDSYLNRKYCYEDKCNPTVLFEEMIELPVTEEGNPDWDFMVNYMEEIMIKAQSDFDNIKILLEI